MIKIINLKQVELFRDLKIRKLELYGNDTDLPETLDNVEHKVQLLPAHIIEVLKKYKSKEIIEDQFAEWINTVWFSDLFQYCDECSDCISYFIGEQEEVDEGQNKYDDSNLEKYIQKLLNIDEAAAIHVPKTEPRFLLRDNLLSIVVAAQALYAAMKILIFLISAIGMELSIIFNTISIIVLLPYACIVYLGIEFIRERPFAWYGITCSFLYLLYKNIIKLIILGGASLFGDSIANFYEMPLAAVSVASHIVPVVIILLVTIFVLMLLLKNDTLERFSIKVKSKWMLVLMNTGIIGVFCALYFIAVVLLAKN